MHAGRGAHSQEKKRGKPNFYFHRLHTSISLFACQLLNDRQYINGKTSFYSPGCVLWHEARSLVRGCSSLPMVDTMSRYQCGVGMVLHNPGRTRDSTGNLQISGLCPGAPDMTDLVRSPWRTELGSYWIHTAQHHCLPLPAALRKRNLKPLDTGRIQT